MHTPSSASSLGSGAPPGASRLPLRRPEAGRVLGGVALGLSGHLDVRLRTVRWIFVALGLMGGVGVVLYIFWWLTIPVGDPADAARMSQPAQQARLSRPLAERVRVLPIKDIAIGVLLLIAALLVLSERFGTGVDATWAVPVLIALVGVGLAWSQLDAVERGRLLTRAGGRTPNGLLRLAGGLVLVLVGVLLFVGQDESLTLIAQSGVAAVAMLAGVALVLAPWWIRLASQLRIEREARAREAERADIAAHLHDSVLQTLALIRRGASDPVRVDQLARAQERELREWLYTDRPHEGTSVAADLRAVVAEIEDGQQETPVTIDVVVVGDTRPTPDTAALLQATREAMTNAVTHGAPPISVYLEVGPDVIEVFVRDRGAGFDINDVPPDRFGVRESILGRVRRRGGRATVASRAGMGTEVHLALALTSAPGDPHATSTDTAPTARDESDIRD